MTMDNGTCYSYDSVAKQFIQDTFYQPCSLPADGEHSQCCQPGSFCLTDGICAFDSNMSRKTSRYYAAECTDPTGKASVCKGYCPTSNTYTYVKWHGGVWQCCYGENNKEGDCANPVGRAFSAPPPAKLSTSTFLVNPSVAASVLLTAIPPRMSASGLTDKDAFQRYITSALKHNSEPSWFAAMPTAVQTYYIAPSLLPQANSSNHDGGSSGLAVKIGVPVAIVVILVLLGVGLGVLCIRRRRRALASKGVENSSELDSSAAITELETGDMAEAKNTSSSRVQELVGSPGFAELPGTSSPVYEVNGSSPMTPEGAPHAIRMNENGFVDEKRGGIGRDIGQGQTQSEFALGLHPAYMPFELDGRSAPGELDGASAGLSRSPDSAS